MRRVFAAVACLLVVSCFSSYDKGGALRVRRGTFTQMLVLTGDLAAERGELVAVPRLPVWSSTVKWLANDGDAVRAGEPVVELDNSAFSTDLDNKRQLATQAQQELQQKESEWSADLEQKQLDVVKKKGELEKATLEAAVPAEILSARDYAERQTKRHRTQVEYDKAASVLASQRTADDRDRANAEIKLVRAARDVATAERAISDLVLRAPKDGVVVISDHPWEGRKLQAGDAVWVGMQIAQLPELDSMQVVASLADVDDGRIAVGMPATVTLDGYPSLHFGGRVSSISAVAQEGNRNQLRRAFRVIVKLDTVDVQRMRPGLSARVEIRRDSRRDVLLAPRAALDFSSQAPRVRLSNGRLVRVALGPCNAQDCVVTGGLSAGQRLLPLIEERGRG